MKNEGNTDLSKCNIATIPFFIIIIVLRLGFNLEEKFKNKQTNGLKSEILMKLAGITGLINIVD